MTADGGGGDGVPGTDDGGGLAARLLSELTGNPINLLLLGVCGYLLYRILKGRREDEAPGPVDDSLPPLAKRDMTVEELKKYDGRQGDGRILMAVNGKVFDVTRGKNFYGPDGPYGVFAGRDASRGLATFSLTEDVLKDGFDDLSDLSAMEMDSVREWEAQFTMKYDYIGRLVKSPEEEKLSEAEKKPSEDKKPDGIEKKPADAEKKPAEAEKKPAEAEKKPAEAEKKPAEAEKKLVDIEKTPVHPEQPPKVEDNKSSVGTDRLNDSEKPQSGTTNPTKTADNPAIHHEKSPKDELPKDANELSGEAVKPASEPVKPFGYDEPSEVVGEPSGDETSRDLLRDAKKNKK